MSFMAMAMMLCIGCRDARPKRPSTRDRDTALGTATPPQSVLSTPDSQLANFLRLAIATRAQRIGMYDSVYTCNEDEDFEDFRWVADSRIFSVKTQGDTAEAITVLTTVADQRAEGDGNYLAILRVAEDTGHWQLVRTPSEPWKVCGDTFREHFNVFLVGRHVRWEPPGASAEKARALIDSIRQSRGLKLIR